MNKLPRAAGSPKLKADYTYSRNRVSEEVAAETLEIGSENALVRCRCQVTLRFRIANAWSKNSVPKSSISSTVHPGSTAIWAKVI